VRVQALTSEIRGTHPPNELRGHGHACDFILIIMAQPDNYNDRDHNHRWGRLYRSERLLLAAHQFPLWSL